MKYVFNLHLTHLCNYSCVYCFCKFKDKIYMEHENIYKVIDSIDRFYNVMEIEERRINLAGGEPLLYPYLDEVIDYIYKKNIEVSIITNGSMLTIEKIKSWQKKVSCIGISIDSIQEKKRKEIGRVDKKSERPTISNTKLEDLCEAIHKAEIELKINTVISKFNIEENMVNFFKRLRPDRLKFLKMEIVEGINEEAKKYSISNKEFIDFIERHQRLKNLELVTEGEQDMENSYLMINAKGEFLLNDNGKYTIYGNCLKEELTEILKNAPIDEQKVENRYITKKNSPYEAKRKLVVFGGHPTWHKSMKKYFKNVDFILEDAITYIDKICKYDVFWIKNGAISHSFYNQIMEIARKYKIPCKYFVLDGAKSCAKQIIDYEKECIN